MHVYLSYFVEDPRQIVSVLSVGAVWLGFAALGRPAARAAGYPELAPIAGWSITQAVLTLVGVYTAVPLMWPAVGLAVAAILVGAITMREDPWLVTPGFLRIVALAAPLLLLTSAMVGSQWDEFADWLISPKYLLVHEVIPGLGHPPAGASLAAYPYGWHFVTYLASLPSGHLIENAGSLVNILLLLSLGHAAIRLAGANEPERMSWPMAGLAAGAATFLNTAFVQKILLTSYADVATSVTLAGAALFGWGLLRALAAGDAAAAKRSALCLALVLMLLVNLKQSTFELYGLLLGALGLAGLCDRDIRFIPLVGHLAAAAIPGLAIWLVWRGYVAAELRGKEFVIRAVADWHWQYLREILGNAASVLLKKSYYSGVMLAAVVAGALALRRCRTTLDHVAITVGAVFLCHVAFLLFTYLAAFGPGEARNVASFWRYNQQLAGLGICFGAVALATLWRRYGNKLIARGLSARHIGIVAMCLVIAAPLVFAEKLRFDKLPYLRHYRTVAQEAAPMIGDKEPVIVLDPLGTGESAVIFNYDGLPLGKRAPYRGAFHKNDPQSIREFVTALGAGKVMLHSVTPAVREVLGASVKPGASYLLDRKADGSFTIVKAWPYPKGFDAR